MAILHHHQATIECLLIPARTALSWSDLRCSTLYVYSQKRMCFRIGLHGSLAVREECYWNSSPYPVQQTDWLTGWMMYRHWHSLLYFFFQAILLETVSLITRVLHGQPEKGILLTIKATSEETTNFPWACQAKIVVKDGGGDSVDSKHIFHS